MKECCQLINTGKDESNEYRIINRRICFPPFNALPTGRRKVDRKNIEESAGRRKDVETKKHKKTAMSQVN
jgi:hypothetical protein